MTNYIVDASVVAERLIRSAYTVNARALFDQALRGDQFQVPEICLVECTNVIWKEVRLRGMPIPSGIIALKNLRALPLRRLAVKRLLNPALALGVRNNLAIYDALYIA